MSQAAVTVPSAPRASARAHGTRTKFVHDKCRCMPCKLANTRYETARYARTAPPWRTRCVTRHRLYLVQHRETKAIELRTYDRDEAFARRDALNTAAKATDLREPLWASPGTAHAVRRHLAVLAAHGISIKRVAALTGISSTRLLEVKNRRSYHSDRPRRRRLRQDTAERILGVQTIAKPAAGAVVPAGPTWKLIDRLLARGITRSAIARALGSTAKTPALQLRRDFVLQRNADAVAAVVAQLSKEM